LSVGSYLPISIYSKHRGIYQPSFSSIEALLALEVYLTLDG
jgi:hypothetical protein